MMAPDENYKGVSLNGSVKAINDANVTVFEVVAIALH